MVIGLALFLITLLLFFGLKTVCTSVSGHSYIGHRTLSRMSKWHNKPSDVWATFPLKQIHAGIAKLVFLDETTASRLSNTLAKAGLKLTPQEYTARKYLIIVSGIGLTAFCLFFRFYFGVIIALLITVYAVMMHHDTLNAKVKRKDLAISQEMPRFVRTLCRSLQSDRDLNNVISAYRKVSGSELGSELDILLAEMNSGNVQNALAHFENRLGTLEAFRLCSALRDMSMGVDQTATLSYMADDMARQAKENIRKELSLRPGKMRMTYYPAIAVCIAMILYVLVVYVINNLNNLF